MKLFKDILVAILGFLGGAFTNAGDAAAATISNLFMF